MASVSSLKKLERFSFEMRSLAIAIVVFTISSLYVQNGFWRVSFAIFPQIAVYVILGFFHAYNVWSLDSFISKEHGSHFMLFGYFLVYTAWYNVVLLPESGLGYIEWAVVLLALTSNFMTQKYSKSIHNPFMGQSPLALVFMGVVLFLCKMFIFYFFEDNLYDSLILTDKIARIFVVIFCLIGLIFLLRQLYKHITNTLEVKAQIRGKESALKNIKRFCVGIAKTGVSLLASLFSLPVIFIIIAVLVVGGLGISFIVAKAVYNSILHFVEPLLEKIMSTGENKIHPSVLYYVLQIVSLIDVLFYTVWIENKMKKEMEQNLEKTLRLAIPAKENGGSETLFVEAKKYLVESRFDEQIRILGSNSIINETLSAVQKEQRK